MTQQQEIDMLVSALYAIAYPAPGFAVHESDYRDAYSVLVKVREAAKQALRNRPTGIPRERQAIV